MKPANLLAIAALLACGAELSDGGFSPLQAQARPHPAAHPAAAPHTDAPKWGPAPAIFPAGAEMEVMQGNPAAAGQIFTVRLRLPNGYVLPAHWHPTDEHVTVIEGTFLVGVGDKFNRAAFLPPLHAGGFITARAHMNHFAMAQGRTVVQVHAIGPFAMTYVNPSDNPTRH